MKKLSLASGTTIPLILRVSVFKYLLLCIFIHTFVNGCAVKYREIVIHVPGSEEEGSGSVEGSGSEERNKDIVENRFINIKGNSNG
jgi:hypothetical protein